MKTISNNIQENLAALNLKKSSIIKQLTASFAGMAAVGILMSFVLSFQLLSGSILAITFLILGSGGFFLCAVSTFNTVRLAWTINDIDRETRKAAKRAACVPHVVTT